MNGQLIKSAFKETYPSLVLIGVLFAGAISVFNTGFQKRFNSTLAQQKSINSCLSHKNIQNSCSIKPQEEGGVYE